MMHMTNRFRLIAAGAALALGAVACSPDDQLAVTNINSPDAGRALARPADVETFIVGSFATWYAGSMGGSFSNVNQQMMSMSLENGSTLANASMGPRISIPRGPILNNRGNTEAVFNLKDFQGLSRAAAAAAVGTNRIQGTFTLGSVAQDLRARAFGNFVMGVALGFQSMVYDSGAVVTSTSAPVNSYIPPLVGNDSVFRASMLLLDSAITLASNPAAAGTGGFPLPSTWIPGNAMSAANFVRFIRSYKAKIRAGQARTKAEAFAAPAAGGVDWALVLADAQNGITADVMLTTNTTTSFSPSWPRQQHVYNTWHQAIPLILGYADTSGAYASWLTQPLGFRGTVSAPPFLIITPDNRFPSGSDLNSQIVSSGGGCVAVGAGTLCAAGNQVPTVYVAPSALATAGGRPYFRARPAGENAWSGDFTNSPYDQHRFRRWSLGTCAGCTSAGNGPYPLFLLAENNGLLAEAAIMTGAFAVATAAIDVSRVAAGLPSVAGIASLATPVPNSSALANDCVPRVPTGALGPTACGNIMEAMKWEKRIETMYTTYGAWFFDSRRWGDLPLGTSLQWPVPYQELDSRFKVLYNRPGAEIAPLGTYGY